MPISRARGAYWAGRAATSLGDSQTAHDWYRTAAHHTATFYGQQALFELGHPLPPVGLSRQPTQGKRNAFRISDLARIARILHTSGRPEHIDAFLLAASRGARDTSTRVLAAELATVLDQRDAALAIAKLSVRETGEIFESGYPILQAAVNAGYAWMNNNFSVRKNKHGHGFDFYYLYGLERACELVTTDSDFARFEGLRWRHPLSAE